MNVAPYLEHIPAIEANLAAGKFDALVVGMGPTAWLLPWIDQKLLSGLRLWGCHDACRIMPMDDLLLMDNPINFLDPDTQRHAEIVKSRPKRLWVYEHAWHTRKNPKTGQQRIGWDQFIAKGVHSIMREVKFGVADPRRMHPRQMPKFKIDGEPPHTTCISPTGCTSLAWQQGSRRIGIIGVDMQPDRHISSQYWRIVSHCFCCFAQTAHDLGGCVANLSPITALKPFATWTPSTSGSAATPSNATLAPSASSSTESGSTQPVPLTSTSCEREILTGPSASTGIQSAVGS